MRYIFKIIILGNSDVSIPYLSTAINEIFEDKETYIEWHQEIPVLDDICEIETIAIANLTADMDQIIPSVDGIIYFLNPSVDEEMEFFQMILDILEKVKRNIPTIMIYYNEDGILPISVTDLLEDTWIKFPDFEAFVNLHPIQFRQALHCLCLAMISGDYPLDIENAWLRYPILVMQANFFYNRKDFYNTAKTIKKIAFISKLYNKENNYIVSEQAAYLFSKINLYQETANILSPIDKKRAYEYKKIYAKAMIREGNKLFKKGDYRFAAKQYENAAQWALIELKEKKFIVECFKLAINSWISACEIENAFTILERLPHEDIKPTLEEVADKVIAAADFLVSLDNIEEAREELYISINTYQRENLPKVLKKFTKKLFEVLIKLIRIQIKDQKSNEAKRSYDEISNLWISFEVKKSNIDDILEPLIIQFLDKFNFGIATYLLNELDSLELKKTLTEYASKAEEKSKQIKKLAKDINIGHGIQFLISFIELENEIINKYNAKNLEKALELVSKNQYIRAADVLQKYTEYLKTIGEINEADRILCELLDILIEGNRLEEFINYYNKISGQRVKKNYLKYIFPFFIKRYKTLSKNYKYEKNQKIFETINLILRKQMLYGQSREISKLFIEILRKEALFLVEIEKNIIGIEGAINLTKKATNISSSYLDNYTIQFDDVYKAIADIYANLGDLSAALSNIDKIIDKNIKKEAYSKMTRKEETKISQESKKIKASLKAKSIKESLSDIIKLANESKSELGYNFKQRKGFKRAFFEGALENINKKNYQAALELYKKSILRMEKIKQYYLAGVSVAIITLIYIKIKKQNELIEFIEKNTYSKNIYYNTFPIILIEYIVNLMKMNEDFKVKNALNYMENLPLFENEKELLFELIEKSAYKEIKKKIIKDNQISTKEEKGKNSRKMLELDQKIDILHQKLRDHKTIFQELFKKRNALKRRYYNEILDLLENDKYLEASDIYYELTKAFSKRKDYENSTLLILLYGLSNIKAKSSIKEIKEKINEYLNGLGTSKGLVSEIFQIDILLFIIDVFDHSVSKYISHINGMLEAIPLFEEEKKLLPLKL
ncbi:MAG: hypothetical protein KGD63_14995 [Candidatus Lokiarchaeota archaeon]|nr:hypothetical protein [Candidatus Lokiarchaeota archaeon]